VESLQVFNNPRLHTLNLTNVESMPKNLRLIDIRNNSLSIIDESITQFLSPDRKIRIASETQFSCPSIHINDPPTQAPTTTPVLDISNSTTSTNETDIDQANETVQAGQTADQQIDHDHSTHPLMWLAKKYSCEHQVEIEADVLCKIEDTNTSEPQRLIDYLTSLNANCTGLVGTTTTPAPPTTAEPTRPNSAFSNRFFDSFVIFFFGLLIAFGGK